MANMLPRVLFVDHAAVLGGAELSLLTVAKEFRDSSRVVLFEDGPFHHRLRERGIETTNLDAPAVVDNVRRKGAVLSAIRAVPALLGLARRLGRIAVDYDVILANSQKSMLVASVAGMLAGKPVVWYARDLMSPKHFGWVQRRASTAISNGLVTHTIANSHATKDALVANGGHGANISVVYNGIDPTPFDTVSPAQVASVREELDLPPSGVVGVFSRLAEWKGQHVLLEALRDLPNVTAIFVGKALFSNDRDYARQLRQNIHAWGLDDRVRMPGFRDDIPTLMHACDAVVHTSTAPEPFGRVIVEGMLAQRPVVATRGGGANEIIDDGVNGRLVPPGNVHALRSVIRELISEPPSDRSLRRAYRSAKNRFSPDQQVNGVLRIVERVQMSPRAVQLQPDEIAAS